MEHISRPTASLNTQTRIAQSQQPSKPSAQPKPQPCTECNGQRYYRYDVPMDHVYFGRMFPCPVCNQQEIDYASGLKDRERRIALDAINTHGRPNTQTMKQEVKKFISNPRGFLSLHGNNGTGKTMALMAIVNAVIEAGTQARYLTASELLAYMRETFNDTTKQTDYDRIHELARIPVLCIDEMDKLRDTPYSREIQQELINLRYRDADVLGTVLAWNGELNDLPWQAVISRVSEFVVVKNNDSDMRELLGEIK